METLKIVKRVGRNVGTAAALAIALQGCNSFNTTINNPSGIETPRPSSAAGAPTHDNGSQNSGVNTGINCLVFDQRDQTFGSDAYRATWRKDSTGYELVQEHLPAANVRKAFTVDARIPNGHYALRGITAEVILDANNNGVADASEPVLAAKGNDLPFDITSGNPDANIIVEGNGGNSGGFEIYSTDNNFCATTETPAPVTGQNCDFALEGQVIHSGGHENDANDPYEAQWVLNEKGQKVLWQPNIGLIRGERDAFTLKVTLPNGTYSFNGVDARLKLDPTHNGQAGDNPVTVAYGNDQSVTVTVNGKDGYAWGIVEGRKSVSGRFSITETDLTCSN